MTPTAVKRKKPDSVENPSTKRAKVDGDNGWKAVPVPTESEAGNTSHPNLQDSEPPDASDSHNQPPNKIKRRKINKLVPPRPFATVPTSVSATGPRSSHTEGKNYICVTRKTPLAAYLRRCKQIVLEDGYKSLHLYAMGAAIPHLLTLATSIPIALQLASDKVHTEILTGTVEVMDEVFPEDDKQEVSYESRSKSTISVVVKIGDGLDEPKSTQNIKEGKGKRQKRVVNQVVISEPEQMDTA